MICIIYVSFKHHLNLLNVYKTLWFTYKMEHVALTNGKERHTCETNSKCMQNILYYYYYYYYDLSIGRILIIDEQIDIKELTF